MGDTGTLPTSKAELLVFMNQQWNGFVAASDALPDAVWLEPVDAAGWSVRDHVAHVVSWIRAEIELLTKGTPLHVSMGMPVEIWDSGEFDAQNAWIRESNLHTSPADVRAERDRAFPRLVEVVSGMSDDDLAKPARESGLEESDRTLLTVMTENYGLHFTDHRDQIEQLGSAALER